MALKAKMLGRQALMRRLNELAPSAEKYAAEAKLEIVKEAANIISADAPHDTGEYMSSIKGERQADNPHLAPVVGRTSRDPDATAVYAPYQWRWLEFGTQPHENKGRYAGTMHPGTQAQPHIFDNWRELKPKAKKRINAAINRAVKEAQGK